MVTDKNFTEGINNLSKEFDKLNPLKKLWYKITQKLPTAWKVMICIIYLLEIDSLGVGDSENNFLAILEQLT